MVAWFKHDIPAWMDGTEDLDAEPYRAHHVICQLIYLNEGPIALNEHGIAGRCKQSIRTFRCALKVLLDRGKLTLSNGRLDNSRAKKELEKVSDNRVNAAKGGEKSGEARNASVKPLKSNDQDQAPLQQDRSLIEKTRPENTREEVDSRAIAVATRPGRAPDRFEEFWKAYPRRDGANPRTPAEKKFNALVKSGIDPQIMIAGAAALALAESEKGNVGSKFVPQAMTWLNQQRWSDHSEVAGLLTPITPEEQIETAVQMYGKLKHWSRFAGPAPGSPNCRATPELMAKYGMTPDGREIEEADKALQEAT